MPRPPRARARVLDAAEHVLLERGAAAFTLDAVAEAADVSKGGLVYHFPSKEALLRALVARTVATVNEALAPAAGDDNPGAFARAYLDATVPAEPDDPGGSPSQAAALGALTVAVALDPSLLDPLREAYERWQARLEADGIDPAAATAVRLAVDGWWTASVFGLPALSPQVHRATRALLERLTGAPG